MDEVHAAALLQARVDLFAREIAALPKPPRSSFAEHQSKIKSVVSADLSATADAEAVMKLSSPRG